MFGRVRRHGVAGVSKGLPAAAIFALLGTITVFPANGQQPPAVTAQQPVAAPQVQTVRKPIGPNLVDHRPIEPMRDVVYARRGGVELRVDIYRPLDGSGPFPCVLTVHGGSWRNGDKSRMGAISTRLARAGYLAVAIDYRLAPNYPFPAQIEDCKEGIRWIRSNAARLNIDPARVGAWGYSAGGHLAALLATSGPGDGLEGPNVSPSAPSTRLKAVVAGGAPTEFRDKPLDNVGYVFWFGGTRRDRPDLYELASSTRFVTRDDPPMFLYHGSDDNMVPIRNSQLLLAQLQRAGVPSELMVIDGGIHAQVAIHPEAARAAVVFLDKHLKAATPPAR